MAADLQAEVLAQSTHVALAACWPRCAYAHGLERSSPQHGTALCASTFATCLHTVLNSTAADLQAEVLAQSAHFALAACRPRWAHAHRPKRN